MKIHVTHRITLFYCFYADETSIVLGLYKIIEEVLCSPQVLILAIPSIECLKHAVHDAFVIKLLFIVRRRRERIGVVIVKMTLCGCLVATCSIPKFLLGANNRR